MKFKEIFRDLLLSILAGISISFGCLIYMLCENKVIGAIFFTMGLFLVLTRGYYLFTGKIAYVFDNKFSYTIKMIWMWFGNLIGCLITSLLLTFTKLNYLQETAKNITENKLSQTPLSAFLMATFCGIIIYLAVENFKTNNHEIGKYLGLLFLIPFFILAGFEHCVADMMYFLFAKSYTLKTLLFLVIITIGNAIGSIIAREIKKKI